MVTPIEKLERLITRHKGLRAASRALDLSPAYVSKLRHGQRPFTDAVLKRLGMERVTTFKETR